MLRVLSGGGAAFIDQIAWSGQRFRGPLHELGSVLTWRSRRLSGGSYHLSTQ